MTTASTPTAAPASPLLALPGAVAAEGVDAGVAAHYGNPLGEQRRLAEDVAFVDRSNRGVVLVPGHPLGSRVLALFPPGPVSPDDPPAGIGSVLLLPEVLAKPVREEADEEIAALAWFLSRLDLRPTRHRHRRAGRRSCGVLQVAGRRRCAPRDRPTGGSSPLPDQQHERPPSRHQRNRSHVSTGFARR